MFKSYKAAILIAVFLMLTTSGCYTKLKSTRVKIVPDAPDEVAQTADWDFGWGWYDPTWAYNNTHYNYYHVNWWDECRWCDDDDNNVDIKLFDSGGKIERRSDEYIIPAVNSDFNSGFRYPTSQAKAQTDDSNNKNTGNTNTSGIQAGGQTNKQPKSDDSNNSTKSSGSNSDSGKKIKRRGR